MKYGRRPNDLAVTTLYGSFVIYNLQSGIERDECLLVRFEMGSRLLVSACCNRGYASDLELKRTLQV